MSNDPIRVILEERSLRGAYGCTVLAAVVPPEDRPRFANWDGVEEVEMKRTDPETGCYEPEADTEERLRQRLESRGGYRVVTAYELDDELAAECEAANIAAGFVRGADGEWVEAEP